jgi:hypothetical protein
MLTKNDVSKAQQRALKEVVSTVQTTNLVRIPTLSCATRRQNTLEQTTSSCLEMQISGELLLISELVRGACMLLL